MKILATPLLESHTTVSIGTSTGSTPSTSFTIDNIQPREFIDLLDQHKVLLLQSQSNHRHEQQAQEHPPFTTDDFGEFVSNLQLEYYPYIGGAAPRTVIPTKAGGDIVFTANERFVILL
jgi:hypothetical protein